MGTTAQAGRVRILDSGTRALSDVVLLLGLAAMQSEKALSYARKELGVQVTCLGEDTAHLSPDYDAEKWLKHIESISEEDRVRLRMNEKRVQKEQKSMAKKAAKRASKW